MASTLEKPQISMAIAQLLMIDRLQKDTKNGLAERTIKKCVKKGKTAGNSTKKVDCQAE